MKQFCLFVLLPLLGCATHRSVDTNAPAEGRGSAGPAPSHLAPASTTQELKFKDLLDGQASLPTPSQKVRDAHGKRVRMVGFMVQMEELPPDGFYLAKRPVHCDEMGAGTGDLPLDAVRVHLSPVPATLAFVPGPVSVEGRLDVGRAEEPDGKVTHLRLFVDVPSKTQ